MNRFIFCLMLAFVPLLGGCWGGPIRTDKVSGQVTFDGNPLDQASINFHPVEQESKGSERPSYAVTDEGGKYKLQTLAGAPDAGTTPGDYVVTVSKVRLIPTGRKVPTPDGGKRDELKAKEFVPVVYTKVDTTPFKATVTKGKSNIVNFEIKSSGL